MIQRTDLARMAAHAGRFLRWWQRELTAMLPARLHASGPKTVLDLRGGAASVAKSSRGGWQPLASFPLGDGAGRTARRALAAEGRLVMAVPDAWILRRILRLPAAAETRLDAVLSFELEQHIPFSAEEVLWTPRILRRLPDAQQIEVEVAVLPRRLVAPAAAELRAMGVGAPLVAKPEPGAEWPDVPLDMLSPPRRRWRGRAEAALALGAILLSLHWGHDQLRQQERVLEAVETRALAARTAAERVLRLEAEVEAARGRLAAALGLRSGRPAAVAVLEELAQRLPDDAWLTELRLTGDQLSISGFAARSDTLLEVLDASPIFREVRFAAPVTRGQRDTADRFQLGLRVVPDAAPAGLALQMVAQ